jgi:hypothetical protein
MIKSNFEGNMPFDSTKNFKYSITYTESTEESSEYSDYSDQGYEVERQEAEIGDILHQAHSDYGIYSPTSLGSWESTSPLADRNYYEKGVDKYFQLHVMNVDGSQISEKEHNFITHLLSEGKYHADDFEEYAFGGLLKDSRWNRGLSYKLDRAKYNKNEKYEVPMSKRFADGGELKVGDEVQFSVPYFNSELHYNGKVIEFRGDYVVVEYENLKDVLITTQLDKSRLRKLNKFAEGGGVSFGGNSIGKYDLQQIQGEGMKIKEFDNLLMEKFPDSFGFELFESKDYRNLIAKRDSLNGIQNNSLKISVDPNHSMHYNVFQGQENTYFDFAMNGSDGNFYIGSFGFKDDGNVPTEYVTSFTALLSKLYGFPFKVSHEVYADGGGVDEKITKERLKAKLYKPTGDFFIEDKGDKWFIHFTPKDASKNSDNLHDLNAESVGNGYYGSAYSINKIIKRNYADGGGVKGVKWDKYDGVYEAELGSLTMYIYPQNQKGYYEVIVKKGKETISKSVGDILGIDNAKDIAYDMVGDYNKQFMKDGGGVDEQVYIKFMNKDKGFKQDMKEFNSYEEAIEWGKKNIDNFNTDMVNYKFKEGGSVGNDYRTYRINYVDLDENGNILYMGVSDITSKSEIEAKMKFNNRKPLSKIENVRELDRVVLMKGQLDKMTAQDLIDAMKNDKQNYDIYKMQLLKLYPDAKGFAGGGAVEQVIGTYSDFKNKVIISANKRKNDNSYEVIVKRYPSGENIVEYPRTMDSLVFVKNYIEAIGKYTDGEIGIGTFTEWIKQNGLDYNSLVAYAEKKNVIMPKYVDGGRVERSYNNPENATHVLHIDGYNWYLEKIDSTHFYMSNSADFRGMAHHIGQHKGEPYYDEIKQWLSDTKMSKGGSAYAKGGLTEHGLKEGDKIIFDHISDDNIDIVDNEGNKHIVDLEKGVRYANLMSSQYAGGGGLEDDGDIITFDDGLQFEEVSETFASNNWNNKDIYGINKKDQIEQLIEREHELDRFSVFGTKIGYSKRKRFNDGGEIIFFDRHASMDSETMDELREMTNYPLLKEYFEGEDGDKKYESIKSALEREGISEFKIRNYLSGLYDGYNYSNTEGFKKDMAKLRLADNYFYNKVMKVYDEVSKYPTIQKAKQFAGGGDAGDNYGGQKDEIVAELKSMKGGLDNKAPYVFIKDGLIYISAENGDNYADYYESLYIDEQLEELANKYDTYWDWEDAGSIILSPIDTYAGGGDVSIYNLRKGDKVKTRNGAIETIIRKTGSGSYETIENDYSHSPESLEFVSRPSHSKMANGGSANDISYKEVFDVLKEQIDDSIEELPREYEQSENFKGEEVESKSRDGFMAFTNGGYEATWFEYISQFSGSGNSLPTAQLDAEMQRQVDYQYKNAKDRFVEEYPEIVEELGEENIDYNSLQEAGYESEAEQLSEWEMDFDGDDSIMCEIGAYYYDTENYRGVDGKDTIRLFGVVNLESPYHRRGNLEDSYDIDITFDSIEELKEKVAEGLEEIISWFNGKMYNDSKSKLEIKRMAEGGEAGDNYGGQKDEIVADYIEARKIKFADGGGVGKYKKVNTFQDIKNDPRVSDAYREDVDEEKMYWMQLKDGFVSIWDGGASIVSENMQYLKDTLNIKGVVITKEEWDKEDDDEYAGGGEAGEWLSEALESLKEHTDDDSLTIENSYNDSATIIGDAGEYTIYRTEDLAEQDAIERVKDDLQESAEYFNEEWLMGHISAESFFENLYNEWNMGYATDIMTEDDSRYGNRLIAEMVEWGIMDSDEAKSSDAEETANERIEDFVQALTEDQINQGNEGLTYYIDNFGKEDAMIIVMANNLIDMDSASQDAVDVDGIGHFLSSYDGNTIYLENNSVAFRTN